MTSARAGCNAGYCNFEIPQVAQGEGGGGGEGVQNSEEEEMAWKSREEGDIGTKM